MGPKTYRALVEFEKPRGWTWEEYAADLADRGRYGAAAEALSISNRG